ncbi:hypothetical protein [Rhodococcus opacus]|uniref:hypothetical protein n=1 Tax=Rhodococcus opacus TaxID=37919 RepID=UPI0021584070|nr:hypothetical protein [Rhodococcus opacus]
MALLRLSLSLSVEQGLRRGVGGLRGDELGAQASNFSVLFGDHRHSAARVSAG